MSKAHEYYKEYKFLFAQDDCMTGEEPEYPDEAIDDIINIAWREGAENAVSSMNDMLKTLIKNLPNDMELGGKIREYFSEEDNIT